MWQQFFSLDFRRRRLLRKVSPGPLHDYLSAAFPDRAADYRQARFVALDLETTGLDSRRDEILSIGLVEFQAGRIDLATAAHYLVSPSRSIPESSAVIHHITDDAAARGRPLAEVLPTVLSRLSGSVLLGHHVRIEREFLDSACRRQYGIPLLIPIADTEALIRRWLEQRNQPFTGRDLRLHALRARYGLPRYKAHNALTDALAAAELFCAFVAKRDFGGKAPLRLFLERQ
jgi:DNA polymerase III subunit epsilon